MAIEMRLCKCGCGKSKLGNAQLMYFSKACKQRAWRKTNKQNELIVTKIDELESK